MTLSSCYYQANCCSLLELAAILLEIGSKRSNELFGKYVCEIITPYTTNQWTTLLTDLDA